MGHGSVGLLQARFFIMKKLFYLREFLGILTELPDCFYRLVIMHKNRKLPKSVLPFSEAFLGRSPGRFPMFLLLTSKIQSSISLDSGTNTKIFFFGGGCGLVV